MRAIRVHAVGRPDQLRLDELPRPRPGPGQVLIRVAYAGLNFADINIRSGRYLLQPALPYVPGFEVSGLVVAHGERVDPERLPIGRRVAALTMAGGGYAEYAVARADHVIPLPSELTLRQGAAFPLQSQTAYHTLVTMGRLAPGETVVIQAAAGGVGAMSTQLARLLGAGRVIAAAGGPDKLRLACALGADEGLDYLRENLPARVNEMTEGRGADLILDSMGGQMLERCMECLAVLGRVVTMGNSTGALTDLNAVWPRLRARSQSLIGFHLNAVLERPRLRDPAVARLLGYVREGRLKIVVGSVFDLTEAAQAQANLEERRTTGKILLRVDEQIDDAAAAPAATTGGEA